MSNHYIGFSVAKGPTNMNIITNELSLFHVYSNQIDPYSYLYYQHLYHNSYGHQLSGNNNQSYSNFYNQHSYHNSAITQPVTINQITMQNISRSDLNEISTLDHISKNLNIPEAVTSNQRPPSPLILNTLLISDLYDMNKLYFKSGTSLNTDEINTFSFYLLNSQPDQIFKIDDYKNIYLLEFNNKIG
jgi:hypothetical protein